MSGEEEEQQWIVVKPSKKKRIEKQIKPERILAKGAGIALEENQESGFDEAFISSVSFKKNQELLLTFLRHFEGEVQVHCLGIGNFGSNLKPYLQLLFLKNNILDLLQKLKITFSVNIYDPVMSEKELSLVKASGWRCDELTNVEKNLSYIFFMPHCQRFLHEKVCSLRHKIRGKKWLVIGNSINDYSQRSRLLGEEIPESFRGVEPKDIKLVDFRQALNDTFIYEL